jgi:hypothetical protein
MMVREKGKRNRDRFKNYWGLRLAKQVRKLEIPAVVVLTPKAVS